MDFESKGSHQIQTGQKEWDDRQRQERFHEVAVKYWVVSEIGRMLRGGQDPVGVRGERQRG